MLRGLCSALAARAAAQGLSDRAQDPKYQWEIETPMTRGRTASSPTSAYSQRRLIWALTLLHR